MAESTYHQAGLQHLAFLQQLQHQSLTHGGHNPWQAEAHLEAYLQRQQYQAALVVVQDLERQRLQKSPQDLEAKKPHHL